MKTLKVGSLYKIAGNDIVDYWHLTKNIRNNWKDRVILGEKIYQGDPFLILECNILDNSHYNYQIKLLTKDGFIGWTFGSEETTIRVTD